MLNKNKKGQSLGGLYGGIIVIVSIGILIALMLFVFSSMGTSFQTLTVARTSVNETIAKPTIVNLTLSAASLDGAVCGTVTNIYNGTGGIAISLGNITQVGCNIVNASVISSTLKSTWLISYPYTYSMDSAASNSTKSMTTMFIGFLPWLGIILLVLAAGVVLFFVIRSFAGNGSQKGV